MAEQRRFQRSCRSISSIRAAVTVPGDDLPDGSEHKHTKHLSGLLNITEAGDRTTHKNICTRCCRLFTFALIPVETCSLHMTHHLKDNNSFYTTLKDKLGSVKVNNPHGRHLLHFSPFFNSQSTDPLKVHFGTNPSIGKPHFVTAKNKTKFRT